MLTSCQVSFSHTTHSQPTTLPFPFVISLCVRAGRERGSASPHRVCVFQYRSFARSAKPTRAIGGNGNIARGHRTFFPSLRPVPVVESPDVLLAPLLALSLIDGFTRMSPHRGKKVGSINVYFATFELYWHHRLWYRNRALSPHLLSPIRWFLGSIELRCYGYHESASRLQSSSRLAVVIFEWWLDYKIAMGT